MATNLRVMSFNILAASYDEGYAPEDKRRWAGRADLNVATIRQANPDVMGVQEMGRQPANLSECESPEYHYWLGLTANPYRFPVTPMRNFYNEWWPAIFWKAACFDVVAGGGFYISRTLDASLWYVSHVYDAHYMHPITWVRLRDKVSGQEFLLLQHPHAPPGAAAMATAPLSNTCSPLSAIPRPSYWVILTITPIRAIRN